MTPAPRLISISDDTGTFGPNAGEICMGADRGPVTLCRAIPAATAVSWCGCGCGCGTWPGPGAKPGKGDHWERPSSAGACVGWKAGSGKGARAERGAAGGGLKELARTKMRELSMVG